MLQGDHVEQVGVEPTSGQVTDRLSTMRSHLLIVGMQQDK